MALLALSDIRNTMSTHKRLLIIGADAAGMSAAAEARRADPELEIVAFDRGDFASYSQCGLPYLVGGVVPDRQRLIARTVESFAQRGIAVRLRHEVVAIDAERQQLRVRDLASGNERDEPYQKLLIATGAAPRRLDVPGLNLEGVFQLDVMEDALAIQGYLERERPRRAVVVGGGYIGLEMAENLRGLGLEVKLVQRGKQLFPSADWDMTLPINAELDRHGVDFSLGDSVLQACEGQDGCIASVQTDQGDSEVDLVLLAIGVDPAVALAKAAGVRIGASGAIAVDDHQRTSLPEIWAAGDCAEHWHRLLKRPVWVPLGTTANKQGRIAGRNIAGGDVAFGGIVGTAITRVFTLGVGRTGISEHEAEKAKLDCVSVTLESTDYAGYMPDAKALTIKLVAERGGRLLGGQAVGYGGVDKRIDVLATALYAGLSVEDLLRLDLEYAPPFNSAWDPIQAAATALLRKK